MSQCGPDCKHESHDHGAPRVGDRVTITNVHGEREDHTVSASDHAREAALQATTQEYQPLPNRRQRRAAAKKQQKAGKRIAHLLRTWSGRGLGPEAINARLDAMKAGIRVRYREGVGGASGAEPKVADPVDTPKDGTDA